MHPRIICHMVSSIDGRLLVNRWTRPAVGTVTDIVHRTYEECAARLGADGWIVGRATMQEVTKGLPRSPKYLPERLRDIHVADRGNRNVAVAIDPHGKVHYGQDNIEGDHAIAILGNTVSDSYLAELREDGVSYIFAGEDGRDLHQAMAVLSERFGLTTLLLEGGGTINGAFLKAGLIDEVSLLVYPGIDGLSGIPSIFEFKGGPDERPAQGQTLRHLSTETLDGGMVWLRYKVQHETGAT